MAEIRECAFDARDARIAPRWIVQCHPHDEFDDLLQEPSMKRLILNSFFSNLEKRNADASDKAMINCSLNSLLATVEAIFNLGTLGRNGTFATPDFGPV